MTTAKKLIKAFTSYPDGLKKGVLFISVLISYWEHCDLTTYSTRCHISSVYYSCKELPFGAAINVLNGKKLSFARVCVCFGELMFAQQLTKTSGQ